MVALWMFNVKHDIHIHIFIYLFHNPEKTMADLHVVSCRCEFVRWFLCVLLASTPQFDQIISSNMYIFFSTHLCSTGPHTMGSKMIHVFIRPTDSSNQCGKRRWDEMKWETERVRFARLCLLYIYIYVYIYIFCFVLCFCCCKRSNMQKNNGTSIERKEKVIHMNKKKRKKRQQKTHEEMLQKKRHTHKIWRKKDQIRHINDFRLSKDIVYWRPYLSLLKVPSKNHRN